MRELTVDFPFVSSYLYARVHAFFCVCGYSWVHMCGGRDNFECHRQERHSILLRKNSSLLAQSSPVRLDSLGSEPQGSSGFCSPSSRMNIEYHWVWWSGSEGKRHLLPNLRTWVQSLGLTWWKERTSSCKLLSDYILMLCQACILAFLQ